MKKSFWTTLLIALVLVSCKKEEPTVGTNELYHLIHNFEEINTSDTLPSINQFDERSRA